MHIFYSALEIISISPYVFYVSLCGNVGFTQETYVSAMRNIGFPERKRKNTNRYPNQCYNVFSSLESQTNFYLIL